MIIFIYIDIKKTEILPLFLIYHAGFNLDFFIFRLVIGFSPLFFAIFSKIPIALISTISELLPAETKGRGNPVGGIEPHTTSYCTINYKQKKSKSLLLRF